MGQVSTEFRFQLRCDQGEEFGVVCQERLIDARSVEDQHVVTRAEFHRTLKMRFVHFPLDSGRWNSTRFGVGRASGSSTADGDNPGKTTIDQRCWLGLIAEQP